MQHKPGPSRVGHARDYVVVTLRLCKHACVHMQTVVCLFLSRCCSTSQGNIGQGVHAYQKAVALDPGYKEAWFNMGQVGHV